MSPPSCFLPADQLTVNHAKLFLLRLDASLYECALLEIFRKESWFSEESPPGLWKAILTKITCCTRKGTSLVLLLLLLVLLPAHLLRAKHLKGIILNKKGRDALGQLDQAFPIFVITQFPGDALCARHDKHFS